jgi:hypothetical protein
MPQFHQHPDGLVFVRADDGTYYGDTIVNFSTDFGEGIPPLPISADERIYVPDKRHVMHDSINGRIVDAGPLRWDYGDRAIAALEELLSAKAERDKPPPPPPEMEEYRKCREAFLADPSRSAFVEKIHGKTPEEVENYIREQINSNGVEETVVLLTKLIAPFV